MGRFAFLVVILLTLTAQAPEPRAARPAPWVPDIALISVVEQRIKLPPGTGPLDAYYRIYAGEVVEGRRMLYGRYFLDLSQVGPPVRVLSSRALFPPPSGPGCAVVDVVFDVTRSAQVSAMCHERT